MNSMFQQKFASAMITHHRGEVHDWVGESKLSTDLQVEIYASCVRENVVASLAKTYPATVNLLGEKFFHAMVLAYLISLKNDLFSEKNRLSDFVNFIQDFKPLAAMPLAYDLARLEDYHDKAYYGSSVLLPTEKELKMISETPPEQLFFTLSPNHYYLQSCYKLNTLYEACLQNDESVLPDDTSQPEYLLINRVADEVVIHTIDPMITYFLQLIGEKQSLAKICDAFIEQFSDSAFAPCLQKVLTVGWIRIGKGGSHEYDANSL